MDNVIDETDEESHDKRYFYASDYAALIAEISGIEQDVIEDSVMEIADYFENMFGLEKGTWRDSWFLVSNTFSRFEIDQHVRVVLL